MSSPRNRVSKRVDHIVRLQYLGEVLLALGAATLLLGISAYLLTVQYTPEQLEAIMRSRPWTLDIFLILPAPHHYRAIGFFMLVGGVVLMAVGGKVRSFSFDD